jgi:hypothetical protein
MRLAEKLDCKGLNDFKRISCTERKGIFPPFDFKSLDKQHSGGVGGGAEVYIKIKNTIQVRSKDSHAKTQLVLWIFILFKVTR